MVGQSDGGEMRESLLVAYGSQNGAAQDYAETVYMEATMKGFKARLITLNEYKKTLDSTKERLIAIIISNTGDGDPPDNSSDYWNWIKEQSGSLYEGTKIALLGLGNSEYESFNNTGKTLERVLPTLGASWLITPSFADARKGNEETVEMWMERLWEALETPSRADPHSQMTAELLAVSLDPKTEQRQRVNQRHLWKIPLPEQVPEAQLEMLPTVHPITVKVEYVDRPHPQKNSNSNSMCFGENQLASHALPIIAADVSFQTLTLPNAIKPVQSVTFTIPQEQQSRWSCQAGDAFGLVCENDPDTVDMLLTLLGLEGRRIVQATWLIPLQEESLARFVNLTPMSVREIFLKYVDIMHFPKKSFLRALAEFCESPQQKNYLLHLSTKPGSSDYMALANGHASIMDFLYSLNTCRPSLECLLSNLPLLHPRFYSVCSATKSPAVEFIYSPMEFEMPDGSRRKGVSTAWLDRCQGRALSGESVEFSVFPRPSPHFRLPTDDKAPVVMICAGTGVSPFIGFLRSLQQEGRTRQGMTWLFYGFRHKDQDYLYKEEFQNLLQSQVLSRLTISTSRQNESGHPKYVQDALKLHSFEIYQLMMADPSGVIYICGDELTMIKSVNAAILDMIMEHGGLATKEANATLASWNNNKKIVRDIWV